MTEIIVINARYEHKDPVEIFFKSKEVIHTVTYSRVSDERMDSSLQTQKNGPRNALQEYENIEIIKEFFDYGITGLNTKKRDGFKNMMKYALSRKCDLIICKSMSRFYRNTFEAISILKKLKEKGVDVYFKLEIVHSIDDSNEFMMTM